MASRQTDVRRVLLAVSEASSVPDLWRAVTEHLADENTELVIVFLNDDRWRRAASLPFTKEIYRASGISSDFTLTRAEQLDKEVIEQIRSRLGRYATEAKIRFAFEIFSEQEIIRIHELLTSDSDVLIAPSSFRGRPIYEEITRLKCHIRFVETNEAATQPRL